MTIDNPDEDDAETYVNCDISVTQLDRIYAMLSPNQRAIAVLNGLNEEPN